MQKEDIEAENKRDQMQRRRVTMPDGRYQIFYTFDEDKDSSMENVIQSKEETGKEDNV